MRKANEVSGIKTRNGEKLQRHAEQVVSSPGAPGTRGTRYAGASPPARGSPSARPRGNEDSTPLCTEVTAHE